MKKLSVHTLVCCHCFMAVMTLSVANGLVGGEPVRTEGFAVPLRGLGPSAKPLELIWIGPGEFIMGCPKDERGIVKREWEPHRVTLTRGFYLGTYEVTCGQWKAVLQNLPPECPDKGDDFPVSFVSWPEAQRFIAALNALTDGVFRLPTEAEWEYACRAGTRTRYWFGDVLESSDERIYSAILDRYFWWGGNNGKEGNPLGSKPVGRKRPNPWGLYDISGNLWEWCSDWFAPPFDRGPQVDPKGPSAGTHRIMRGGGWESYALHLRSADRCPTQPNDLRNGRLIGLRIAADDTTQSDRSRR